MAKRDRMGEVRPRLSELTISVPDIEARAASLGLTVPASACLALAEFGKLFLQWNERINVGGHITAEALVERHLADAMAAQPYVVGMGRVIDVGSGGGLPAIPLAVLSPGTRFELYEPTAKKGAFLRTAIRLLALGDRVTVHPTRVDPTAPSELAGVFDVACSRATMAPPVWLSLGMELVRPGGTVLVFASAESGRGLPRAAVDVNYAPDRRLLVFYQSEGRVDT